MEQKQCVEAKITLTYRRYDILCPDGRGGKTSRTSDVELIVDVEGVRVYSVRGNPWILKDENSLPTQFEQWAFKAYRLSEEFKRRHNGRSDGCNAAGGFKLFWRKVFRKFVDFKP